MTISLTQLTPRLMFAHLQRRRRAKRLGVNFSRRGSFRLPNRLLLGGNTIELDLLHERGTKADFLGIFLDDMYMIESLEGMRSVLDIGANQGLFSIYARSLYPDATIHAYEPNPALEAPLGKNCEPLDIAVFMEGVSEADGSCNLQPMGDSNLTRTVSADKGGVPVVGIARALERLGGQVDLLKLDCEGCEWEVFKDRGSLRRVRYLTPCGAPAI